MSELAEQFVSQTSLPASQERARIVFNPQLRISKRGGAYLRRLLVSSAQYVLGPFAPPSALRQYGLALAASTTARAKKRAVVAVARKLAVLLLTWWKNKRLYHAFPQQREK